MKKVIAALLSVLLVVSSISGLFTLSAGATGANLFTNGDLADVSAFQTTAGAFTVGGFAGKASGTGSSVAVGQATDLPAGAKGNTNAIKFTLDSSSTVSNASMYTSGTYTLKENTYYEASMWIKTTNLYGMKFFLYEPTYTDRLNRPNQVSLSPMEGQNVYSFSYDGGTDAANVPYRITRVSRTDLSYTLKANGLATDGTGISNGSMGYLRGAGTADQIANGTAIYQSPTSPNLNAVYYEPSLMYGTATNGWVKVTLSFKTKSGTWSYPNTDTAKGATDIPYAVPIAIGLGTRDQAVRAGNISTLSVAGMALNESFDVSASIPDANKGGSISINGVSGLSVSAPVSSGDAINLVATPFGGNNFVGWFDSTGTTLISSNLTYTTTCSGNIAYIAKFANTSGNLFNNPGFEAYSAGTVLSVGANTKSTDGWSNGSANWMTNTVVSTPVFSGTKSLKILNNYNDGAFYAFTVEPNSNYKVSLKWNMPLDSTAVPSALGYAKITNIVGVTLSGASYTAKGTGNWEDATLTFNSGINTTVRLCIRPDGPTMPVAVNLYVDDIVIVKTLAATITTSTTGASTVEGGAASASKASFSSGESITFTAKPYPGNTFSGWYKSGVLYNSNLSFTEVVTDNVSYEARFICVKPNMVSDAGFESLPLGAFFNVGTAINPNWTGSAVWGTGTIVNTFAADGSKSLMISQRHNTSTRHVTGLKANTDYQFSFLYYFTGKVQSGSTPMYNSLSLVAVTSPNYTYLTTSTGGIGPVGTSANGTVLGRSADYDSNTTVYGTWAPVTITFNTGDFTAVDLHVRYASEDPSGATSVLYVDDMSVIETTVAAPPTTPTATCAGYTAGTWTKNDVPFTLSGATYADGIAKYQYSTDGINWSDITSTNGTITKDANNNVTQVVFPVTNSQDKTYSFRAVTTDDKTSAATAGISVKIDKVVPVVGVSAGSYTAGTWTKNDVVFTLSNTATNLSSVAYKVSTNGTTWSDVTGSTFTVAADTNASYQFKAVSGTGIESTASTATEVKVQKTAPTNATVVLNPADPDTGAFYKTAPTITITAPTVTGTAPVTTYYKLWTGTTEPTTGTVFTGTNQPIITVDGIYNLKVWTVDEAENVSANMTKIIRVDANATVLIAGDINGDAKIDLYDVTTLARYIAFYNVTCQEDALDVNGDGAVDLKDVTILTRYVAGWNVTLANPRSPR